MEKFSRERRQDLEKSREHLARSAPMLLEVWKPRLKNVDGAAVPVPGCPNCWQSLGKSVGSWLWKSKDGDCNGIPTTMSLGVA